MKNKPGRIFNKPVLILSFVSLLNDISSEFLYPILPVYLKGIGFSVLFIGILEGFAEAAAGLSKGYFGKYSDLTGRRTPFITAGYSLSAVSKPMLAMFTNVVWIFFARSLDKLGKGVRTAARDAMLSDNSLPENRAKVFGFHRGMDSLGAVAGPAIALAYLSFFPGDYKNMFLYAFIPALFAVALTLLLKDKSGRRSHSAPGLLSYFSFLSYWKESGRDFRLLTAGLFGFALINSSDMFLLLMMKHLGYSDTEVVTAYMFFNLVFALTSLPAGALADRMGYRKSLIAGLLIFASAYSMMAFASDRIIVYSAFFLYGLFPSFTEGVSKAWISNISPKEHIATALGFFTGLNSLFVLLSGAVAGLIWSLYGPEWVFLFSSAGAVISAFYFIRLKVGHIQPSR